MATLRLTPPLIITSRLLPGVRIGQGTDHAGTVSLDPDGWEYHIDLDDGTTVSGDDFRPAFSGGMSDSEIVRDAMATLLSFLSAYAEAVNPRWGRDGENADLFPDELREWAYLNDDEIQMAQWELDPDNDED